MLTAFSPCPNDTFLFHAWCAGLVGQDLPIEPVFEDVQTLNQKALKGTYPISKVSFAVLNHIKDEYVMLPVGAALGFGVGPKIVAKTPFDLKELSSKRLAIPGEHTTAHLLAKNLLNAPKEKIFCTYDQIFSLIDRGIADCGLIIHEQRFIFQKYGFYEIVDLGALWEKTTHLPLPLGCIVAKRSLDLEAITRCLRNSLLYAWAHPEASKDFILHHARVKDPKVCKEHIDLYVSNESLTLSELGTKAIKEILTIT